MQWGDLFTDIQLFFTQILSVCAGATCIAGALAAIIRAVKSAGKPYDDIVKRVNELEKRVNTHERLLENDKGKLDEIDKSNHITQKALLALLSHALDGNDVDNLRKAKTELHNYLIEG